MNLLDTLQGHTSNCLCIEFDSSGKYFATGSADAIVNIWDSSNFVAINTLSRFLKLCFKLITFNE